MERLDGALASIDKSKLSIDSVNQQFQYFEDTAEEVSKGVARGFDALAEAVKGIDQSELITTETYEEL